MLASWKESYDKLRQHIKNQRCHFANKGPIDMSLSKVQGMVKDRSEKIGLKLNIQKMKIMASSPITSWQIDRDKMETETDFIFLGSKITVDGGCSHEIMFLGR